MDIVIHNNQWYWGNTLTLIRYDGMASVELQCDNKYPTIAFIKGLIVHDTYRNQGIGNKMLDACFSEAIKLNKLFLQLNVLKDSWLVGWYERKGFIIIYEDDNEYTMWKQLDLRPQNKCSWNDMSVKPTYPCDILYQQPNGNMFIYRYIEGGRANDAQTPTFCNLDENGKWIYLKDIKPLNKWKPSDEQLEYLLTIKTLSPSPLLESLYVDLKKLREE